VAASKFHVGDFQSNKRVHLKNGSTEALIERNYSQNLIGKEICIIGGGTLGSYLAHALIKHGAGVSAPLHIYDEELMLPQNLSRHLLGSDSLFQNKAVAMYEYLTKTNPDRIIKAYGHRFDTFEKCNSSVDIIIDATGDFSTAAALSHQFKLNKYEFKLYHGYLCAGGKSVRLFKQGEGGCYRCLFDRQHEHHDREFKNTNTRITINRNCGESNVQFPVDSSMGAASFMAKHILEQEFSPTEDAYLFFEAMEKSAAEHKNKKVPQSSTCPACYFNRASKFNI
jgi:molybdopterin/thiamine biosynthesis adenylyltransferase